MGITGNHRELNEEETMDLCEAYLKIESIDPIHEGPFIITLGPHGDY